MCLRPYAQEVVLPDTAGPVAAPRALYLHFPFCTKRCHYCDFSVKRSSNPPVESWLKCIDAEFRWWFNNRGWPRGGVLDSIYVGGGTPSLMRVDGMKRLRNSISSWFTIDPATTEWTAEANPASFDTDLGVGWREAGVNRLSLGLQALDDAVLGWLGRLHDRDGALEAVAAAHGAGFGCVNVDLIFGLPDEVERDLQEEVETIASLDVAHVSLYGLTVEPRTPLAQQIRIGRTTAPSPKRYASEYKLLSEVMRGIGYTHYELSNFARPDTECRHNWAYWDGSSYLAVGPSAHQFFPPVRSWNLFRWEEYASEVNAGRAPLAGSERIDLAQQRMEEIWLGLRTKRGLAQDGFDSEDALDCIERWVKTGWLEPHPHGWQATVEGWLRVDSMTVQLSDL